MVEMIIKDVEYVKEQVKSFLPHYLEMHGRKTKKGHFACPNESAHKNQHKEPSAGFADKHSKTVWNCFGCGVRGDIFHAAFHIEGREIRGAGFVDTLVYLADTFNILYEKDERQENILRLNEMVCKITKVRPESKKAIEFLERRNLMGAAEAFELGYCTWSGLSKVLHKYFESEVIHLHLDEYIFNDRLIIPIRDENSQLVGFAGRALSDNQKPKYINSRTSSLYEKGRTLYNLHNIQTDNVHVVEGYADVWRLHMSGYSAVAPCGTAFTKQHLDLLYERGIKNVVFCFDGDSAGLKAQESVRAVIQHDSRFEFGFMTLPGGKDPDELIREQGSEAFEKVEIETVKKPIESLLMWTAERIVDYELLLEEGGDTGYKIGWNEYMERMDGVQKGLHLVGGLSNVGKTTWMLQMFRQLTIHNGNVIPVFFSIDDDWHIPYLRLVASEMRMPINEVKNYKRTYEHLYKTAGKEIADRFMERRRLVAGLIYEMVKRAPIFDITKASKLTQFEEIVKTIKHYTGQQVVMFVDNFHKIRDKPGTSTNERFTIISEELKRITVEQELATFATVEFRKLNHNGRPTLDDVKESVDIVYDSNAVYILHNDLHSKQGDTNLKYTLGGKDYPIIEMSVAKNKLSAFKGRIYFKTVPEWATYEECTWEEQKEYSQIEVKRS